MRLKEVKAEVRANSRIHQLVVIKPNVFICVQHRTRLISDFGFARWNVADEGVPGLDWDPERGTAIARGRAEAAIAQRIVEAGRS